jgi:8-oxo-dGTP diphosphatase
MPHDPNAPPRRPSLGAGMVCFRGDQVLLIKRGKAPRLGEWSIPGGHVEWGETAAQAAMREVMEETGIEAEALALIDVIDAIGPGDPPQGHYILIDYLGRWVSGEPKAGSDAADAVFAPLSTLESFGLWGETHQIILKAAAMAGLKIVRDPD